MNRLPRYLYRIYANDKPMSLVLTNREAARSQKRTLETQNTEKKYRIYRVPVLKTVLTYVR
jgi:hypothetical protein